MIINLNIGGSSDEYLPLSGGTMTGSATIISGSNLSASPANGDDSNKIATASWWQNHLVVQEVTSGKISVASNSNVQNTFSVTKSGYTPIALVGYNGANGSSFEQIHLYRMCYASNNIYYGLTNLTSSSRSIILHAYVLYRRG